MRGHGEKLTRKQEAVIAALLSQRTHAEAAVKAGVSEATLQRWLLLPPFKAAYRDARRQVFETALGGLQQAIGEAVDALRRSLKAKQLAQRIRAALGILQHGINAAGTLDLGDQLAELKQQLEEQKREQHRHHAARTVPANGTGKPSDGLPDAGTHPPGPGGDHDRGGPDPGPLADGIAPLFQ